MFGRDWWWNHVIASGGPCLDTSTTISVLHPCGFAKRLFFHTLYLGLSTDTLAKVFSVMVVQFFVRPHPVNWWQLWSRLGEERCFRERHTYVSIDTRNLFLFKYLFDFNFKYLKICWYEYSLIYDNDLYRVGFSDRTWRESTLNAEDSKFYWNIPVLQLFIFI